MVSTHLKMSRRQLSTAVIGVLISKHGGRQLYGVPETIDALRDCAPPAFTSSAEPGQLPQRLIQVAVHGGSRRGSDIFKALAHGAQMCFLWRISLWGLAVSVLRFLLVETHATREKTLISSLHTVRNGRRRFKSRPNAGQRIPTSY